jgi:hypothetical protein
MCCLTSSSSSSVVVLIVLCLHCVEMSKREFLQEKVQLLNQETRVRHPQAQPHTVLALQADIEQVDFLLQGLERKNKEMDVKIIECEHLKTEAERDLALAQSAGQLDSPVPPTHQEKHQEQDHGGGGGSEANTAEDSTNTSLKSDIAKFQTQKAK